jgi:hypothetical protein
VIVVTWGIAVGDVVARRAVHDEYGGSRQGGIASCAKSKSDNILIFTSDAGKDFGYNYDQWEGEAVFHYTGEGQNGHQVFTRGNMALRDHVQRGQRVRLFEGAGRAKVRYLGELRISEDAPYRLEDAPGHDKKMRKVIVFRLVRVDDNEPSLPTAPGKLIVKEIPIEEHATEAFFSNPAKPTKVERREAALVERYTKFLTAAEVKPNRHAISLPYRKHPFYTDLFDTSRDELVEAKGSASRDRIRLAIGQLCDYGRYVGHQARAVLLPKAPEEDLVQLLNELDITCIYETETDVFVRREP